MKIFSLEATDMGADQQEIADKCLEYVADMEFNSREDFDQIEGELITRACKELGWHSVPQSGGLLPEFE